LLLAAGLVLGLGLAGLALAGLLLVDELLYVL
jgi:hypothetical protein